MKIYYRLVLKIKQGAGTKGKILWLNRKQQKPKQKPTKKIQELYSPSYMKLQN